MAELRTKQDLLEQSIENLEDMVTHHRQLLSSLFQGGGKVVVKPCRGTQCNYRQRLKAVLIDTIQELEKTRCAFKSKRLELLRRKLEQELFEMD